MGASIGNHASPRIMDILLRAAGAIIVRAGLACKMMCRHSAMWKRPKSLPILLQSQTSIVPRGEEVIFEGSNPTFHRFSFDDYRVAVSNAALYLPVRPWRPIRPPVTRIPLSDIESVTLRDFVPRSRVLRALLWCVPVLLWVVMIVEPWRPDGVQGTDTDFKDFVMPAFLVYMMVWDIRANRGRSELVVQTVRKDLRFLTPADTYTDDKTHDRAVLRKVLEACRSQAVSACHDKTEVARA